MKVLYAPKLLQAIQFICERWLCAGIQPYN